MDITYLLIISAAVSVLVLAVLDALRARRRATNTAPPMAPTHRALVE